MRDGFGMLLKEIKLLGDRMKSVEKKVGITKKGTASNDLQITASSPPKCGQEPGKDFGEMFSRWDFDVEDSVAENIIKVMSNAKPRWKWTMDCWEVAGTKPSVKKEVSAAETETGVKEESGRPRKKTRKEKSVEARAEAIKVAPTEARS
ncbi:hypothetical protein F2Q69_00030084 [Brassica cretica]|uniref:Uncharacterized protein n=1 Tax=Brassica cretica TaxID=69181 RepID=A0A8S9RSU7_BRACR|nr:hypothetical protein F2Q69_00030084 [Brassica cretica]